MGTLHPFIKIIAVAYPKGSITLMLPTLPPGQMFLSNFTVLNKPSIPLSWPQIHSESG